MGSNGLALRVLFGAILFFGVIWILFVGILANHATATTTTTTTTTVTVPSTENFKNWKLIAREKHHTHQDSDLNYVSMRKVPNGPDPIHNRRASKARQPPGRI